MNEPLPFGKLASEQEARVRKEAAGQRKGVASSAQSEIGETEDWNRLKKKRVPSTSTAPPPPGFVKLSSRPGPPLPRRTPASAAPIIKYSPPNESSHRQPFSQQQPPPPSPPPPAPLPTRQRSPSPPPVRVSKKRRRVDVPPPPRVKPKAEDKFDEDGEDDLIIIDDDSHSSRMHSPPAANATKSEVDSKGKGKEVSATRSTKSVDPLGPRKKKGRLSLEKVMEKSSKMSIQSLISDFPTVTSFIHHLRDFEFERPPKSHTFEKCKIVVVNGAFDDGIRRNPLDKSLGADIQRMRKAGIEVLTPEEFMGSAKGAIKGDAKWDNEAEVEGWTTHIYHYEIQIPGETAPKQTSFSKILKLLGKDGVTLEEMGDYCKIVDWGWIGASINQHALVDEWSFELEKDPRRKKTIVTGAGKGKAAKKTSESKGDIGRSRKRQRTDSVDDLSDSENGSGAFASPPDEAGISPYGPNDYPIGEEPHPSEFATTSITVKPGAKIQATDASAPHSSSIEIQDAMFEPRSSPAKSHSSPVKASSAFVIEGLEEELAIVREFHEAGNLDLLDREEEEDKEHKKALAAGLVEEDFIFSTNQVEDNATDEEGAVESDDEGQKEDAAKERRKTGEHWTKRRKYACDLGGSGGDQDANPNESTAIQLDQLGKLADRTEPNKFRAIQYRKAASKLRNTKKLIDNYADAMALYGVGDSIASKIVEIHKTGTQRKLTFTTGKDKILSLFQGIYNVGLAKAQDFYDAGCRSLDDLRTNPSIKLSDSQALGLKYYDDCQKRIPREEVALIHERAVAAGVKIDPKLQVLVMGSYRRGQADCGDIDLMVTRDISDGKNHRGLIKKLAVALYKEGLIRYSLTNPEDWNALDVKFNGFCALPGGLMRRIDILGVPWDEMPAALIYFTGNDFFNRSMRLKARHLGYRLNQRGLYKNVARGAKGEKLTEGVLVPCKTEEDIFKKLHVPYRPPTERRP